MILFITVMSLLRFESSLKLDILWKEKTRDAAKGEKNEVKIRSRGNGR
jgi:hypothetical protein